VGRLQQLTSYARLRWFVELRRLEYAEVDYAIPDPGASVEVRGW
jgi:hypothetical protein